MEEFLQRLIALRSGAGNAVKGAGRMVDRGLTYLEDKDRKVQDAKRARNEEMIVDNFGSLENYRKFNEENPMPTSTIGDFFRRVLRSRQ